VPNVNYKSVDPGVILRYQLLARMALIVGARVQLMLETGEIQTGDQYGVAGVFGLDVDAGLEYDVTDRILVGAYGHYQRIAFAFKGQGALTDRDDDGEADVGGAADLYLGGFVTAGYRF
jgi:hypothetical protein